MTRAHVLALCALLLLAVGAEVCGQSLLQEAIAWRWPGAQVVTSGDTVVRWDGPMARPTGPEIAQALTDYQAQASTVKLDAAVMAALDSERLTSAVVWTILKQMYPTDTDAQTKTKYGVARQRIIDAYKLQPWK